MIKIGLSNIETHGHHGVFKEEQEKGNLFFTDVDVWFKSTKSVKSDDLEDTFDYQIIYDVVNEEMKTPCKLLEHLAGKIVKTLAKKDKRINIRISNRDLTALQRRAAEELKAKADQKNVEAFQQQRQLEGYRPPDLCRLLGEVFG